MKAFFTLFLLCPFLAIAQGWVDFCPSAKVKLEVVEVTGTDVTFDLKIMQLSNSACGSFGLGSSDFVIDFNNAGFANPTINKLTGFCDFVAVDPVNNPFIRFNYESNTSPAFIGPSGNRQIAVSLNGPTPSGQAGFDSGVALIDQTEYTYSRFTLGGYDGTTPLDFEWHTGSGLATLVFGIENGDFDNDGTSFLHVAVEVGDTCVVYPTITPPQGWVDLCPETKVKLEVVEVTGSDVTFDLKISQSATSSCGSFGLGASDFVIDFNNSAFTNPAISNLSGFCDFVAVNPVNNPFVQFNYENNTSPTLLGAPGSQQMVISLNGPTPTDQAGFDSGVALIDQTEYTYSRFTLSGYDGVSPLDFEWYTGTGLATLVFGIENGDYDNDGVSFLHVVVEVSDTCVVYPPTNPLAPDFTSVLTMVPSNIVGTTPVGVAASIVELSGNQSDGTPIKVTIPVDSRLTFTWDPTLTSVAFNTLDNAAWNYLGDNGFVHTFEYTGVLDGGEVSTFGFLATYDPQNTSGTTSLTCTVAPLGGGETEFTNNTDSEQLIYFD